MGIAIYKCTLSMWPHDVDAIGVMFAVVQCMGRGVARGSAVAPLKPLSVGPGRGHAVPFPQTFVK